MSILSDMISVFDRAAIWSQSDNDLIGRETEFRNDIARYTDNGRKSINEAYDSIDTKATAILQHVSIMIAVSGVLYSTATPKFLQVIFVCEMLLYVGLALCCLRLFMTQHMSPTRSETFNVVAKEAFLDLTAKITFLVSIALVLTVIAEVIWK
jgi:hypothetical protein